MNDRTVEEIVAQIKNTPESRQQIYAIIMGLYPREDFSGIALEETCPSADREGILMYKGAIPTGQDLEVALWGGELERSVIKPGSLMETLEQYYQKGYDSISVSFVPYTIEDIEALSDTEIERRENCCVSVTFGARTICFTTKDIEIARTVSRNVNYIKTMQGQGLNVDCRPLYLKALLHPLQTLGDVREAFLRTTGW